MSRVALVALALAIGCDFKDGEPREATELRREAMVVGASVALAEAKARLQAAELKSACVDTVSNAANVSGAAHMPCPRSDQRLSFEKDADGDAWIACRCERATK